MPNLLKLLYVSSTAIWKIKKKALQKFSLIANCTFWSGFVFTESIVKYNAIIYSWQNACLWSCRNGNFKTQFNAISKTLKFLQGHLCHLMKT